MDPTDQRDPAALPSYPEDFLAGLDPAALVDLMLRDEDRVPRNVIDACAGLQWSYQTRMITAPPGVALPF